ncbi:hypothetical protein CQW23_07596 [Capsicum baccatum]|uniref:Glycosyl transferase CAP10 domain-containing protein n=1 Tax=Capsicum baccatum TaxID=33114 RepID=A0A2G2X6J0_CAPBA|nr:hypothetical protein CQW23_07596 [Capsicum baccatum]
MGAGAVIKVGTFKEDVVKVFSGVITKGQLELVGVSILGIVRGFSSLFLCNGFIDTTGSELAIWSLAPVHSVFLVGIGMSKGILYTVDEMLREFKCVKDFAWDTNGLHYVGRHTAKDRFGKNSSAYHVEDFLLPVSKFTGHITMISWKSALVGALWKMGKPRYLPNSVLLSMLREVEQIEAFWRKVLKISTSMVVFGILDAIKTSQDPFDFVEDVPKSIPIPGGTPHGFKPKWFACGVKGGVGKTEQHGTVVRLCSSPSDRGYLDNGMDALGYDSEVVQLHALRMPHKNKSSNEAISSRLDLGVICKCINEVFVLRHLILEEDKHSRTVKLKHSIALASKVRVVGPPRVPYHDIHWSSLRGTCVTGSFSLSIWGIQGHVDRLQEHCQGMGLLLVLRVRENNFLSSGRYTKVVALNDSLNFLLRAFGALGHSSRGLRDECYRLGAWHVGLHGEERWAPCSASSIQEVGTLFGGAGAEMKTSGGCGGWAFWTQVLVLVAIMLGQRRVREYTCILVEDIYLGLGLGLGFHVRFDGLAVIDAIRTIDFLLLVEENVLEGGRWGLLDFHFYAWVRWFRRRYDCGVIFARQMLPHFVHITFAFSGQLVGEIRKNSLSTKFRVKQYKTRWIVKQSLVAKPVAGYSPRKTILTPTTHHNLSATTPAVSKQPQKKLEIQLNCTFGNLTRTCPASYYPSKFTDQNQDSTSSPLPTCPDYFRWIYDDLWPWRETGITKEMVMRARRTADFRLVIVNGRAYVETYRKAFQSRDTFTLWGILQMLRRYPGKVPDLDLMFDCVDWPVIKTEFYRHPKAPAPPPLFRYCGNDSSLDIVFPDWSFWGWPEINIKPWETLSKDLKRGNEKIKWTDREPYAYWKGNPVVAETRMDLLKCNVSEKQDWSARVYAQDWVQEQKQGYKQSDLASQCIHRYKIYVEGSAWSVSEKYILACDSVTLLVKPHYYDFYTRGLMPLQHYWPVKDNDKCRSIKHAVDWGNTREQEAQAIGKAASDFIQDQLKMDYVYDYMFHLLSEYAKLLKYKPTVPRKAVELCSEAMACPAEGLTKKFMLESMVEGPSDAIPCSMPPPFGPAGLHSILGTKENSIKQVDSWEQQYWKNKSKQQ